MNKILIFALIGFCATSVYAKDLGTYGNTFPISEENFLTYIMSKYNHFKANGGEKKFESKVKKRIRHEAMNPSQPIQYSITKHAAIYYVDPSIILKNDIRTPDGHYLGHKGQVVNPLKNMPKGVLREMIFIDGTDLRQVTWAKHAVDVLKKHQKPYYLILVKGNLKKAYDRLGTIKFDYFGMLSQKTGIKTVPSIVMQSAYQLQVQQIPCQINYCDGGRV